ncbi:MAG: hypothetical protein CSA62_03260 [Planctomycetota bacterium]|nr:MAG: hypothetical protein CSA62_03260 [Planctomycetota bacterium]
MNAEASIRKANVRDVARMLQLINGYAQEQIMLPRSPLAMYETLRDFTVIEDDGEIMACGALHVVWGDMAELRSIAVAPQSKGKGYGRILGERLLEDARELLIPTVYTFTYVPDFFEKLGFRQVEHSELPHKVFGDCMNCPKFNACDEIAMLRSIEDPAESKEYLMRGKLSLGGLAESPFPRPTRVEK